MLSEGAGVGPSLQPEVPKDAQESPEGDQAACHGEHPTRPVEEAVLARAQRLPWVTQFGRIESARLTMDGKRFDLNCGCKLFYPDGAN